MSAPDSGSTDLRDLTLDEAEAYVARAGLPRFRAEQIFRGMHQRRVDSFDELTDLPRALRSRLSQEARIGRLEVAAEQVSRDGTRKLALRTADGRLLETVLIPDGDASAPD